MFTQKPTRIKTAKQSIGIIVKETALVVLVVILGVLEVNINKFVKISDHR